MIKYKVYILPYILSLSIHEANKMHLTGATLLRNIGAHFRRALKFGPSCAEAHWAVITLKEHYSPQQQSGKNSIDKKTGRRTKISTKQVKLNLRDLVHCYRCILQESLHLRVFQMQRTTTWITTPCLHLTPVTTQLVTTPTFHRAKLSVWEVVWSIIITRSTTIAACFLRHGGYTATPWKGFPEGTYVRICFAIRQIVALLDMFVRFSDSVLALRTYFFIIPDWFYLWSSTTRHTFVSAENLLEAMKQPHVPQQICFQNEIPRF